MSLSFPAAHFTTLLLLVPFVSVTEIIAFHEGPAFTLEPEGMVDFSNNTGAQIGCSARGAPPPHVRWTVGDGSHVTDVPHIRRVFANGTLVFPPFGAEEYRQDVHAAVYRCLATNSVGSIVSRDVWVRAVVMQLYEVQVYDEFVITGNTGVLRCHIPSFVTDYVSVTSWFHDGVYGAAAGLSIENGHKFTILPSGELHIKDVTMNDGLTSFKCRTYHRLTKETRSSSTSGRLIVTAPQGSVPPRITDSKLTLQIRQGEVVTLPCAAQGHPPPSYTWFRRNENGQMEIVKESGRLRKMGGSLYVQNGRIDDSGLYTCVVNNSIGSEKAETTLTVTAQLSARVEPEKQVVDLGHTASLRCITDGFPISSVRWLKDGKPLDASRIRSASSDVFQLLNLRREDMGMYQCVVKNNVETVHATAEIKIGDAAPEFHHVFESQSAQLGSSVSLMCIASGNPQPTIVWTVDEGHLPSSGRISRVEHVSSKGEVTAYLNITHAKTDDGGEYKCVASNPAGKIEHSARLNVYGPPAIRPTRRISALAGGDSIIRCPYYGYPIEGISWEKDSLKLPVNRRQRVFPNGTLIIQNVQPELDPGKYTCVIRNPQGLSARRDLEVVVVVPPVIAPFSFQGEQFVEGMRTRATCYVSKGDLPITITWLKNERPLSTQNGIGIRVIDEYSSILTIDNVTHAHSGNFTCVARNAVAVANFSAKLIVNVPPRWVVEPRDASVLIGHQVVLNCRAEGSPTPVVTWMKAEGSIPGEYREIPSGNSRLVVASNGSLMMSSAAEPDDGEYMCQAANGVGAGLSRVVRLDVHVPPYFVERNKNYTVKRGDDARMVCEARGDVPIKITWFVNGNRVTRPGETSFRYSVTFKQTDNGATSELVIRKPERHDNAVFSCVANNSFGSSDAFLYLIVQQVPEAPSLLKVIEVKSRSVDLSWSTPYDGNNPILRYLIQHKEISESWDSTSPTALSVPAKETKVTLFGLKPDHSYHLRAKAENSVGIGASSEVLTITTHEEAPGGPPRQVQVVTVDSQTLKVTWKPPNPDVWFGDILGYNIAFRPQNSTQPLTSRKMEVYNDDDTSYHFLVTGLKKFTRYVVMVQAFNRHGNGPFSEEAYAQTQEDVPSKPPQNIVCLPLSAQSLKLSWDHPPVAHINGIVLGYKVLFKSLNSWYGNTLSKTKSTTETSLTLFGLEAFTNYSIQVFAFTRVGDGSTSLPITCATAEDVPDAPADIKAVASSSDTIVVSWKPPVRSKGTILRYTVYVRALDGSKEETTKHVVSPENHSFVAKGLRKNRRHEFWVTASTSIGEGQSTKVVAQSPATKVGAKISSFDGTTVIRWKMNVTLPCNSVGVPPPEIEWNVRDEPIGKSERFKLMDDGSLWIHEVFATDAANYTCRVRNAYGTDSITYTLMVQAPPSPPSIGVASTGLKSIHLQWEEAQVTAAPILGYSLSFRREYGEWEELQLENDHRHYTLDNLWCGTRYQMYMTAYSTVGPGKPSDIINVKTKGSAPIAPSKHDVIVENVTSVMVLLDGWSGDGCPILYFIIEYRMKSDPHWTLVSNHVKPEQERFPIGDLEPRTQYELRITAHNNAGSTLSEFEFTTRDSISSGGMPGLVVTKEAKEKAFYADVRVVVPGVVVVMILVAATAVLCLIARRRRENIRNRKREAVKMNPKYALVLERGLALDSKSNTNNTLHKEVTEPTRKELRNSSGLYPCPATFSDDVCPYATFQLASFRQDKQNEDADHQLANSISSEKANSTTSLRMADGTVAYSKVIKPRARQQHCPQESLSDERVPDLLYHSQESSSSNDNSPDGKNISLTDHLDLTYHRYPSVTQQRYPRSPFRDIEDGSLIFHNQDMPPPYYPDISPNDETTVLADDYYHYLKDLKMSINESDHRKPSTVMRHQELPPNQPSKSYTKDYTIAV